MKNLYRSIFSLPVTVTEVYSSIVTYVTFVLRSLGVRLVTESSGGLWPGITHGRVGVVMEMLRQWRDGVARFGSCSSEKR